jgi:hypothetical protein
MKTCLHSNSSPVNFCDFLCSLLCDFLSFLLAYSIASTLNSNLPFHIFASVFPTASAVWWTEFLATDPEVPVQFADLPDFLTSSGSGTESTQPREYNRGDSLKKK